MTSYAVVLVSGDMRRTTTQRAYVAELRDRRPGSRHEARRVVRSVTGVLRVDDARYECERLIEETNERA